MEATEYYLNCTTIKKEQYLDRNYMKMEYRFMKIVELSIKSMICRRRLGTDEARVFRSTANLRRLSSDNRTN